MGLPDERHFKDENKVCCSPISPHYWNFSWTSEPLVVLANRGTRIRTHHFTGCSLRDLSWFLLWAGSLGMLPITLLLAAAMG